MAAFSVIIKPLDCFLLFLPFFIFFFHYQLQLLSFLWLVDFFFFFLPSVSTTAGQKSEAKRHSQVCAERKAPAFFFFLALYCNRNYSVAVNKVVYVLLCFIGRESSLSLFFLPVFFLCVGRQITNSRWLCSVSLPHNTLVKGGCAQGGSISSTIMFHAYKMTELVYCVCSLWAAFFSFFYPYYFYHYAQ